ncbi:hypothetical protein Q5P01_023195 [Channa striata]|uniref:Uncharacterized protein n=1 Tax=Channa striata TaxID=64152 RepID=A0AA88LQT9_CHASR|nr:hypothetical protein Q5P01_023195 [Channa striata]
MLVPVLEPVLVSLSEIKYLMAKDKRLTSESNLSKRKKLSSHSSEVSVEEMMGTVIKRKRKKIEVEEASADIPHVTTTEDDIKKKDKKRKKKGITAQTNMEQTEVRLQSAKKSE